MRHYITEVTNPVPPAPDSNSGQNPGPVSYNVVDGRDSARQALLGTSSADEFRVDRSPSIWSGEDRIFNFEKGRDRISLDGGGDVWWGIQYKEDAGAAVQAGYFLYSTSDGVAGNNVIAEITFGSNDSFTLEQADFGPGTRLAGRASHDVLDFSGQFFTESVDMDNLPDGETTGHVVLIDNWTYGHRGNVSDPDSISNFRDGQDIIAVNGGGTVYIQNGADTGSARTVTLRTSNSTSNENNVLATIQGFTGTFDANDLTADLTVEII